MEKKIVNLELIMNNNPDICMTTYRYKCKSCGVWLTYIDTKMACCRNCLKPLKLTEIVKA